MIEHTSLDDGFFEQVQVNKKAKSAFQGAAKWGKFVAIIGLILVGGWFLFEMVIIIGVFFTKGFTSYGAGRAISDVFFGLIHTLPFIFLLKFSNNIKASSQSNNEAAFTKAMLNHRNLFRLMGVLWIFYLVGTMIAIAVFGTAGLGLS